MKLFPALIYALCVLEVMVGAALDASGQFLAAQETPRSIVATVAETKGLPLILGTALPRFGTFWVVRNSIPAITAPLPCAPFDATLQVYAITRDQFLVDQTTGPFLSWRTGITPLTDADLDLIVAIQSQELLDHVELIQNQPTLFSNTGTETSLLSASATILGGGDQGSLYPQALYMLGADLCLYPPVIGSGAIHIAFTNTLDSGWLTNFYDLFYTTNLTALSEPALGATNWSWLERSSAGQTNFVVNNPGFSECYFRLGTMQDSDADGLTDAYESLVSHTDPARWDTDNDGLSDGWEVSNAMNPRLDEASQAFGRRTYQYDGSGWLRLISGASAEAIAPDDEGNLLTAN